MNGEVKTMKLYEKAKIETVEFFEEVVRTSGGEFMKDNEKDNMFQSVPKEQFRLSLFAS